MCWNAPVSFLFATLEAVSMGVIIVRARKSTNVYIRGQLWIVPLLCTILLAEVAEAFLWLDPTLISVYSKISSSNNQQSSSCSSYNQFWTWLIWLFVFPLQPLLAIMPCRRVGPSAINKERLKIPEALAITFVVVHYFYIVAHQAHQIYNPTDQLASRENIQQHGYQIFANTETCTYIGIFHHLFWTLDTTESWFLPNANGYMILVTAVFYAQGQNTWRFLVYCMVFNACLIVVLFFYYRGSVEVASVWCWTGIAFHIYVLFQPYLLPCRNELEYRYESITHNNTSTTDRGGDEEDDNGLEVMPVVVSKQMT